MRLDQEFSTPPQRMNFEEVSRNLSLAINKYDSILIAGDFSIYI